MSLDVYLIGQQPVTRKGSGIFIRDAGSTREISRLEWDARFPGREPVVVVSDGKPTREVYTDNITHNVRPMAELGGFYRAVWDPEGAGIRYARDLIGPLATALVNLRADPARFAVFDDPKGWGTCVQLTRFIAAYLEACLAHPEAEVKVSR